MKPVPAKLCCGCAACASACPKNAITMVQNNAGFYNPEIDNARCVNCGLCKRVCPEQSLNWRRTESIQECYACANRKGSIRDQSSSGGVFYELAKAVLAESGYVYGCAWGSATYAHHVKIERVEQLPVLMKSKYVQSDLKLIYRQVKEDLASGTKVLFSGTPCQNAGLICYLGKRDPNLMLVEFICHGVPSQGYLSAYVNEFEQQHGAKVESLDFRTKINGWEQLTLGIKLDDGTVVYEKAGENPYYRAFLLNLALSDSCSACQYNSLPRTADITLGDFWKVHLEDPIFRDHKGVSCVVINSQCGKDAFEKVESSFVWREVDFESVRVGNPFINGHCKEHRNAKRFAESVKKEGFTKSVDKLLKPTTLEIIVEIAQYKLSQLRSGFTKRK